MRRTRQGHALRSLPALTPRSCFAATMVEPDERSAAEVRDEKRDAGRAERIREALAEDSGGGDRRGVLNRREQLRQVQPCRSAVRHARTLGDQPSPTAATSGPRRSLPSLAGPSLAAAAPGGAGGLRAPGPHSASMNREIRWSRFPWKGYG
jgi:hypothetical protein